jgi:ABC-type glycerol-3-phosphate transport system substrate-binding protein
MPNANRKSFSLAALLVFAVLTSVLISGMAGGFSGGQGAREGSLLVWHTWSGGAGKVLEAMLARYMALRPGVRIVTTAVDEQEIAKAFADRNAGGLGPDLLLVDAGTLYDLATARLLRDVSSSSLDFTQIKSGPLRMVSDGDAVYGLPFAGKTEVLFYNRKQVTGAPADYWDWLARDEAGETFALNPGFVNAYWGVGALGGGTIDPTTGEVLLRLGGFKNWLEGLRRMRAQPGSIMDDDPEVLRQAFIGGAADFYFGSSDELPLLQAALDEDAVGVAALPYGPNGSPARPLLGLAAFGFSKVSNPVEFALARDVAGFLSSAEAQVTLSLANVGWIPVNNQVRPAAGMPQSAVTIARQVAAAQPVRFANQGWWRAIQTGATGFMSEQRAVVEGIITADDMIDRATRNLKATYGFAEKVIDPAELCPAEPAAFTAWHAMPVAEAEVLAAIVDEFTAVCPGNRVTLTYLPSNELHDRYVAAASAGSGPDLLLGSSSWLPQLAEQGLIQDISELVPPEALQRYLPRAAYMMRYDDRLYGLPESVMPLALYLNTALVADPPLDLEAMLQTIDARRRWALPVDFFRGFWGLTPFGGLTWDGAAGEIVDADGLRAWLGWLQDADKRPGVDLYADWQAAEDAFVDKHAAYFVSGPWSLPRVRAALGDEGFRVVPLPGGSQGTASPILTVQGAMLNATASQAKTRTALALAHFINLNRSQRRFLATGQHVSASATVDQADYPNLDAFRRQAGVAAMVAEDDAFARMQQMGDDLYQAVLFGGETPEEAVARFVAAYAADGKAADAAGASDAGPADTGTLGQGTE